MAKGKLQKPQRASASASRARDGETPMEQDAIADAPNAIERRSDGSVPTEGEAASASPYDREPDAGGGALVFLGIIAVLLAGAITVGLMQAS
ncbi:MAG: hypothetical protein R3B40_30685 [Polyangiales bacterium]|nr:hypothetical protein [Myxococcales bacterium]MCB9658734.1 hypothetical protein [Sandaracinaceae bacterium]